MFRKLLLVAFLVKLSLVSFSQTITDTATLRNRINTQIVPNSTQAITATKLNQILNGYLNTFPKHWMDSLWRVGDSLKWKGKSGTTFTIYAPTSGGGGGSITYPYTTNKFLNGYGNFVSLPDSVRNFITLTTTGFGGAATYNSSTGVFNIPNSGYPGSGIVYQGTVSYTIHDSVSHIISTGNTTITFPDPSTYRGRIITIWHSALNGSPSTNAITFSGSYKPYYADSTSTLNGQVNNTFAAYASTGGKWRKIYASQQNYTYDITSGGTSLVGTSGVVWAEGAHTTTRIKGLKPGTGVSLSSDGNDVTINSTAVGGGSDTTYTYKNTLYNDGLVAFTDNFSRTYFGSDYTLAFPGTTETINSEGMRLVGNPNNYSNYIVRNFNTASENFELTLTYVNNSISSADSGIFIGMQSQNTNCCGYTIIAGVRQATGHADFGKSFILGPGPKWYTGSDAISSISVGDTMQIKLKRNALTYSVISTNITTGETSTNTVVTELGLTPSTFYPNNTSKPIIYFLGGDIKVIGEEYRLLDTYNADYAFVGNSITTGSAATAYNKIFANRTFESDSGINVITLAGGGDVTDHVISRLPELYKLKPRYVVLMMGGNDVYFSYPAATWKANLLTIRDSLVNHGIKVIHLAPTPRGIYDMLSIRNYIDTLTAFQGDIKVLSTYDSLLGIGTDMKAVYNAGDNVHLTDSGQHYVALKIREVVNPQVRTPIPTIPLPAIVADGWNQNGKLFLSNTGWDTIPRSTSGGGGTPALNQYQIGVGNASNQLSGGSDFIWNGSFLQAKGGLISYETSSSQYSYFRHENIGSIPNSIIRVGNTGSLGNFSSLGVIPGYEGGLSPTVFYLSNWAGYLSGSSTQYLTYLSASGADIVHSTMNGFGSNVKSNYYFNTDNYAAGTSSSLTLLATNKNGINTTSPDSTFQVNGGLKFVTGRQGAGKVLVSDANGGADWQTVSGSTDMSGIPQSKGFTLESPTSSENFVLWKTQVDITVSSINAVVIGSSPSVTINIAFGSNITSLTNVFSSGTAITNTTTGQTISSGFNDATIPAGSWILLTSSAASGTITLISATINYTED